MFTDGGRYLIPEQLDGNVFEQSMASQVEFRQLLRDDSFAFSLMHCLKLADLCAIDGAVHWSDSRDGYCSSITRLRHLGEYEEFRHGGPFPEPPLIDRNDIESALVQAGWRFC